MRDTYRTIEIASEGIYTEQRSKFIAFIVPVKSAEEIKAIVEGFRKKYYDARHVCWACMLGPERQNFRVNDDGEPSSTAGKPILGVINSHELTDILIVVIRYFGGVKLGTGGLISAYRAAASEAVSNAKIIEKTVDEEVEITFEYPFLNAIMRVVKEENPEVVSQHFDIICKMILRIRRNNFDKLKKRLLTIETISILNSG